MYIAHKTSQAQKNGLKLTNKVESKTVNMKCEMQGH